MYQEDTLRNVIKSVTRNGRSIILTAILALIIVYLFSIIGYLCFRDDFQMEVDSSLTSDYHSYDLDQNEDELSLNESDNCLANNSSNLCNNQTNHTINEMKNSIYDLLFFFVVIIIILNLIFGVIIDTFADLRSEKQQKEEILKNTCFICGQSSLPSFSSMPFSLSLTSINL